MVDSTLLYNSIFHKVKVVDIAGNKIEGYVDVCESESDSDSGLVEIGLLPDLKWLRQDEIESIEILD